MARKAPLIDPRSFDDIAVQTRELLVKYLNNYGWQPRDDGGEAGKALVGVFAHYCGLLVDRINRAPEKNFLAFLDLLGNSPVSAIAAQVPVTFFLDATATDGFNIPSGTRIQAASGDGAATPLVFETGQDLWITNFELKAMGSVYFGVPTADLMFDDLSNLIQTMAPKVGSVPTDEAVFSTSETNYFFGLQLAGGRVLAENQPVSLFFFINNPVYSSTTVDLGAGTVPRVLWKYWSGNKQDWVDLWVEDTTGGLVRSGTVEFLAPADFVSMKNGYLETELFWIRAYLDSSVTPSPTYNSAPRLNGLALNTVMADQAVSVRNEVLGSSSGNAGQTFNTFKKPVLPGQHLEVREMREAGTKLSATQTVSEDWTSWKEVQDFYISGPLDRHYVVNRQAGEIVFGNGLNGMIPPSGTRNVRMALYRTTSGVAGNVPAGALRTLMAGAKHIYKVTNFASATGGADTETQDSLLDRAPKALRHRSRAVAKEDYEDLAKLASTEVARVLCVPLIDLATNPCEVIGSLEEEVMGGGKVSVIIVPSSKAVKPLPSQTLMRRVESYLREHCTATTTVAVVGPLYLRVKIDVQLKLESMDFYDRVQRELQEKFASYLHPLTGRDGQGWPFGRQPHESDIHRLIGTVAGVNFVTSLQIKFEADEHPIGCASDSVDCIEKTGRFLIYSGQHTILPSI